MAQVPLSVSFELDEEIAIISGLISEIAKEGDYGANIQRASDVLALVDNDEDKEFNIKFKEATNSVDRVVAHGCRMQELDARNKMTDVHTNIIALSKQVLCTLYRIKTYLGKNDYRFRSAELFKSWMVSSRKLSTLISRFVQQRSVIMFCAEIYSVDETVSESDPDSISVHGLHRRIIAEMALVRIMIDQKTANSQLDYHLFTTTPHNRRMPKDVVISSGTEYPILLCLPEFVNQLMLCDEFILVTQDGGNLETDSRPSSVPGSTISMYHIIRAEMLTNLYNLDTLPIAIVNPSVQHICHSVTQKRNMTKIQENRSHSPYVIEEPAFYRLINALTIDDSSDRTLADHSFRQIVYYELFCADETQGESRGYVKDLGNRSDFVSSKLARELMFVNYCHAASKQEHRCPCPPPKYLTGAVYEYLDHRGLFGNTVCDTTHQYTDVTWLQCVLNAIGDLPKTRRLLERQFGLTSYSYYHSTTKTIPNPLSMEADSVMASAMNTTLSDSNTPVGAGLVTGPSFSSGARECNVPAPRHDSVSDGHSMIGFWERLKVLRTSVVVHRTRVPWFHRLVNLILTRPGAVNRWYYSEVMDNFLRDYQDYVLATLPYRHTDLEHHGKDILLGYLGMFRALLLKQRRTTGHNGEASPQWKQLVSLTLHDAVMFVFEMEPSNSDDVVYNHLFESIKEVIDMNLGTRTSESIRELLIILSELKPHLSSSSEAKSESNEKLLQTQTQDQKPGATTQITRLTHHLATHSDVDFEHHSYQGLSLRPSSAHSSSRLFQPVLSSVSYHDSHSVLVSSSLVNCVFCLDAHLRTHSQVAAGQSKRFGHESEEEFHPLMEDTRSNSFKLDLERARWFLQTASEHLYDAHVSQGFDSMMLFNLTCNLFQVTQLLTSSSEHGDNACDLCHFHLCDSTLYSTDSIKAMHRLQSTDHSDYDAQMMPLCCENYVVAHWAGNTDEVMTTMFEFEY